MSSMAAVTLVMPSPLPPSPAPLEPTTPPAVCTASGRFSPRRRLPTCRQARDTYLQSLVSAPLLSSTKSLHTASKVKFDLSRNALYTVDTTIREECDDETDDSLWYTAREITQMRQENNAFTMALRNQTKQVEQAGDGLSASSWQACLKRLYQAMTRAANADDLMRVLESEDSKNLAPLPVVRGVEAAAVTLIALDTTGRRRRIIQRIHQCQVVLANDPVVRADMIRQTSTTLSRPTRLLARQLAVWSWQDAME